MVVCQGHFFTVQLLWWRSAACLYELPLHVLSHFPSTQLHGRLWRMKVMSVISSQKWSHWPTSPCLHTNRGPALERHKHVITTSLATDVHVSLTMNYKHKSSDQRLLFCFTVYLDVIGHFIIKELCLFYCTCTNGFCSYVYTFYMLYT